MRTPVSPQYPVLPKEPSSTRREDKIYLVTHADLSAGHQIAQTAHVIAELAVAHPEHFYTWHDVSGSLIVLSTPDSASLFDLYVRARKESLTVQVFREPDLGDEITALAFLPHPHNVRFLASLPLAGKKRPDSADAQVFAKVSEAALKKVSLQVQNSPEFNRGRLLRECYFAYVDHLHGRVDLSAHFSWDVPAYSDHERAALVSSQPHPWVMDRALTFFFVSKDHRQPYAHDERIHTLFDQPQSVPGWDVIMSAFTSNVQHTSTSQENLS